MRILSIIGITILAMSSASVIAKSEGRPIVHEYKLKNGLQLFVKEDHRAPIVVSQVWYKVGSSYETRGITGISHVLEHMMFKGTKKHGVGEFSKIVAHNGGVHNAFTSDDFTGYYQVFEADKLKLSFELESDRMRNLILDPKEFKKEIQVVMEERRMRTDDNPHALTYERFKSAAHVANPYHHPVVGWMDDLENLTVDDVSDWYNLWYSPNNALVVVVGDVKPEKVYALAKKYFGHLKPKDLPIRKPLRSLKPLGMRTLVVKAPAKLPWIIMGYNAPSLLTANEKWEPYALEVLSAVLDSGESARLPKEIVRGKQIASGASAGYSPFNLYDTLVTFSGTPSANHTVDDLKDAFYGEIARLQSEMITTAELSRVKAQVIASRVFDKDSMENQAMEIGSLESIGLSWRTAEDFVKNIEMVTPEQVQAVAKKYLNETHLTLAVLEPLPISKDIKAPSNQTGGHHVN